MVEIDPDAAAEVQRIFDLIRNGTSVRATAEQMTDETGRQWRSTVVDRIVRREVYKQKRLGQIVNPKVWGSAQAALASRRRRADSADKVSL